MGKFLSRFIILLLIIIFSFIIYLSYFGIETNKFDALIKEKANSVNQNVKLEFNKTKIHLNPAELNLVVKLKKPKVVIRKNPVNLSKLNLFLSIKSFFSSNFLLTRAEIAFAKNDIKDLTKITNIFVPKIINKKIDKIFEKGEVEGEFIIPFDAKGNIADDYGFSGKVLNASIKISKEFYLENLTTKISHRKNNKANFFNIEINKGTLLDFNLTGSTFILERQNRETNVKSLLKTSGKFNLSKLQILSSLLNLNINNIKDFSGNGELETNIDFKVNKKFKIKNLFYSIAGNIPYGKIHFKEKKIIKNYLPSYNDVLIFKDTKIKLNKTNPNNIFEINGLIKIKKRNTLSVVDMQNLICYMIEEQNLDYKLVEMLKGY